MSPLAKMRIQLQLLTEGAITPEEILERIRPVDVAAFLRPEITDKTRLKALGRGLGTSGGAASGRIAFSSSALAQLMPAKDPSILVVRDWNHEVRSATRDVRGGVDPYAGVLATTGGISSHAALVCRQAGKPCVANFNQGVIAHQERRLLIQGFAPLREGDWLTIDGLTGDVYEGRSPIEAKPWESHPELVQFSLIVERAVCSGHVPPKGAGMVWRIWDFLRHELPLPGHEPEACRGENGRLNYPRSADRDARDAQQRLVPIDRAARRNYSELLLGLMTTLDRQLRSAAGNPQPYCRVLWDPDRHLQSRNSSQLVGFEFFGINRRIPHLIEISDIRCHLDCEVESSSEAWAVKSVPGYGSSLIPRARTIKACHITVNGAELDQEDVPTFYTWLRRREYFWHWFDEHETSHQELATFLKQVARTSTPDPRLSVLCRELGLLKNGRLTAAGLSLIDSGKRNQR